MKDIVSTIVKQLVLLEHIIPISRLFKSELINPALFCNNLGVFFNTPIVMKITTKVMKNPVTPQKRHFVSRTVIDNSKRKSNQRNRPPDHVNVHRFRRKKK